MFLSKKYHKNGTREKNILKKLVPYQMQYLPNITCLVKFLHILKYKVHPEINFSFGHKLNRKKHF